MQGSRPIPWARFFYENVLIVASILAAFSIDAWWDGRQEARIKAELVSMLKLDFETTRKRIAQSTALADSLNDRAAGSLKAVGSNEPVAGRVDC